MANKQFVVASLPVNKYVKRTDPSSGGTWGSITGTLSSQTDLQTALDGKVNDTGNETIAGVKTFSSDPLIPDEAYGVGWDGVLEPPTKNAVYDKIQSLPTATPQGIIMWDCNSYVTSNKYGVIQAANSGTIADGIGGIRVRTNATSNATAQFGGNTIGGDYPFASAWNKKLDFGAHWLPASATGGTYAATMLFGYAGASPTTSTLVTKHIGFIIIGTTIWASNANDTTQTKTDITGSLSITRPSYWRAVITPSTDVKFYVNSTLVATHTTNLPTGDFDYSKSWSASIQNISADATDRNGSIGSVSLQFAAE